MNTLKEGKEKFLERVKFLQKEEKRKAKELGIEVKNLYNYAFGDITDLNLDEGVGFFDLKFIKSSNII